MSRDSCSSLNSKKQEVAGTDKRKRRKWDEKIIERLKDGSAYPHVFMNMNIPERSVYLTLSALKREETIYQDEKRGKYFLLGYEDGPPERWKEKVREIVIDEKNLDMYLSWGWKFQGKLDGRVIVRYERALREKYV